MIDIQKQKPSHELPINMVGICDLRYPIRVLDHRDKYQNTVATFSMFVDLPHNYRGTHMSRFIEILNRYSSEIAYNDLDSILMDMKRIFDANSAQLLIKFPYFILRNAPVSDAKSFSEYKAFFDAKLSNSYMFELGVEVPVTLVCPCSKEISDRGAHNQRAQVTIRVRYSEFVWLEELIEIAESSASAPIFSLLKRSDEKYVTELSYDNPKFVEDVAREIAQKLLDDERITYFKIEVKSYESIHNHNAYAMLEK